MKIQIEIKIIFKLKRFKFLCIGYIRFNSKRDIKKINKLLHNMFMGCVQCIGINILLLNVNFYNNFILLIYKYECNIL
jgi:hypothetical protein